MSWKAERPINNIAAILRHRIFPVIRVPPRSARSSNVCASSFPCPERSRGITSPLIEKTDNIAAVQRQLGHTNAAYSIQYARVTDQELADALDDR